VNTNVEADSSKIGFHKSGVPRLQRSRLSNRKFGLALAVLFLSIGLASWFLAGQRLDWAFIVGGIFLSAAVVAPAILLPVNLIWHNVTNHIRIITNWVILGSIYYFVITPAGLALRLFGHDPLVRRKGQTVDSYFTPVQRRTDAETMQDWF